MRDLSLTTFTEKIAPKIFRENMRQLEKWGIQDHDPFRWLAFATEELGELSKAISEWEYREGIPDDVVKEAVETATLVLKIAEMFQSTIITKL